MGSTPTEAVHLSVHRGAPAARCASPFRRSSCSSSPWLPAAVAKPAHAPGRRARRRDREAPRVEHSGGHGAGGGEPRADGTAGDDVIRGRSSANDGSTGPGNDRIYTGSVEHRAGRLWQTIASSATPGKDRLERDRERNAGWRLGRQQPSRADPTATASRAAQGGRRRGSGARSNTARSLH